MHGAFLNRLYTNFPEISITKLKENYNCHYHFAKAYGRMDLCDAMRGRT
jgi:hypothetical protein